MFLSYHEAQECNKDILLLNSGCSNHMTREKSLFVNLDTSVKFDVILSDDKVVNVVVKGTFSFLT